MEAIFAAAAAAIGLAAVLLVAASGLGLTFNDEYIYAAAARELAHGRQPWCFGPMPFFIERFGFPYLEIHARGSIATIALAFRIFGDREWAACLPAIVETVLVTVAGYACGRLSALPRSRALLGAALVAFFPPLATFSTSAFPETGHALGYALGAVAIVAPSPWRFAVVALGTAAAVAHRETGLILPFAVALGAFVRDRRRSPALLLLGAGLAAGLATYVATKGTIADRDVRAWMFFMPFVQSTNGEGIYTLMPDGAPPPVTSWLVIQRLGKTVGLLLAGGDNLAWTRPTVLAVDGAILLAVLAARRRPEVRGLSIAGLLLYAAKSGLLVIFHEPPGLYARHIAAEGVFLVLALLPLLARPRGALCALGLVAAFAVVDRGTASVRGGILERQRLLGPVLLRLAPRDGGLIASENAWRLVWDRPGQFTVLVPWTPAMLEKLARRVPIERLILDVNEPLVASQLVATGRAPGTIGPFTLVAQDTSLGATLLVYDRAP
jgi:hypothetical protein